MKRKPGRKEKRHIGKTVLRLLRTADCATSRSGNSLSCPDAQRGYRHAIDEFVDWYCLEPRLSFSKTVVVRYRMHLETRHLAPRHNQSPARGHSPAVIMPAPSDRRMRVEAIKPVLQLLLWHDP
jgi:hypothetical protein